MPTAPRTTDELYQALQDNDQRPYGRARSVTAEELVDAAEQFAEPLPLVHALFELHEAYTYGSEPRKSPVVFARLLTLFDEQPDVFDERLRRSLFWRFKWVANALRSVPEMPLASLRQWLTEMRDRYEKAGHGLQPYYGQAYQLAAHVGEDTALAHELWASRSRTPFSDCEACEIRELALYQLAVGDDERALRAWEPVLAGQESCKEEPARSVSYALLPLLRTGRTDRARELHLAGYRGCRRDPSMSAEVGRHLEFCALTGNEARGLELLAENRSLFEEVDSPLDTFDFLTGVEVLLQRVEALGHGDVPAAGYAGRSWTVAGLRAEVRGRADDLAARFDARNGTTAHVDRREVRLGQAPLLESLELTLRPRSLDEVTAGAGAAPPAALPAAPAAVVPESLTELIVQARALDEQGHPGAQACWARLRKLVAAGDYAHPDDPAVGPFTRLRADLLAEEGGRAGERDDFAAAAARYEEAARLYAEAGDPPRAATSRAAAHLSTAQTPPEAPTEGAGEPPAGPVTGAPAEGAAEEPAQIGGAGEPPAGPVTKAPAEGAAEEPAQTEGAGEPPAGPVTGAPAEGAVDAPAQTATVVLSEAPAEGAGETPAGAPAGPVTEASAQAPAQAPAGPVGEVLAGGAGEAPARTVTEAPAEGAVGRGAGEGGAGAAGDGSAGGAAMVGALGGAHAAIVRLQEGTPGLAPFLEARLLRLRATALGVRLQTSGSDEHVAPVLAEVDLLEAFATRHDLAGQISGARLLRASTYAISGDLPAAVTEADALIDRLTANGPAWHLPRAFGLRGRLHFGLKDPQAAYADLSEGLRLAADWPADAAGTAPLHGALAEACMHLGRPEEALRHLTRSAELDLRRGSRTEAYCTYSNAAQLCLDLDRVEDCIALLDSVLAEPDVAAGELDDRLVAQLRLTRARALHAGEDLKAATAEFVALAAESAGWDDDPGSHAMIAAETAVLLGESGDFGRAREAAGQALAAHARSPRYEQLSSCLREIARLQAQEQGPDGLADALAHLADAGRIADEARAAQYEARGRSLETALAYEHGRVNAYAGEYEAALAAVEQAIALLGDPGPDADRAAEWAECVRLAATVEGRYLDRPAPALTRLDAAVSRLTALGHPTPATPLTTLSTRLRTNT